MKRQLCGDLKVGRHRSLPARGAWVETSPTTSRTDGWWSLPARGAWVETPEAVAPPFQPGRRSPQGERGLKPPEAVLAVAYALSLPARGAWVETRRSRRWHRRGGRSPQGERGLKRQAHGPSGTETPSLPARGAWVETGKWRQADLERQSLPARGAWVETRQTSGQPPLGWVAPRKGSVG